MSRVTFHIGTGKTGTSSIQSFLFDNYEELAKNGVYYAKSGMYVPGKAQHLLSHKWGGWLSRHLPEDIDFDACWQDLRAETDSRPGRYIVSSERFTGLSTSMAGRKCIPFIRSMLPDATINVVIYLRRQDDLLESVYKQGVKTGHINVGPDDYLKQIPSYFDYKKVLDPWAEVFGEDAVSARIYGRRRFLDGDLLRDFFDLCHIPWTSSLIIPKQEVNPSISDLTARLVMDLDITHIPRRGAIKRFIRAAFDSDPGKAGLFSAQVKHDLMKRLAASNAEVMRRFIRQPGGEQAFTPRDVREDPANTAPAITNAAARKFLDAVCAFYLSKTASTLGYPADVSAMDLLRSSAPEDIARIACGILTSPRRSDGDNVISYGEFLHMARGVVAALDTSLSECSSPSDDDGHGE